MIEAYPLSWPQHFHRCKTPRAGLFKTTLAGALNNVESSLRLFARDSGKKIEGMVISSNVTLGANNPTDPGVAVWFIWDGLHVCIPVDRYTRVEANLQAIHHIVESRRVELRHGGLEIVRATFAGFKALPAPGQTAAQWRDVLNLGRKDADLAKAKQNYLVLRSANHPDKGGDAHMFDSINRAWEQAQRELGA